MLYIMCALKSEAQAFVDRYRLTKTKQNSNITVIVTGIGSQAMFNATKDIINNISNNDTIVNIGICGGSEQFFIGELVDCFKKNLTCVDSEVSEKGNYELVDMESAGFLKATEGFKNRYIFKVVSDHFQPHKVTKEKTKSLIFNVIDDINEIVYSQTQRNKYWDTFYYF